MSQAANVLIRRERPYAAVRAQRVSETHGSSLQDQTNASFVLELSHELRTTLLNVSGYAELLSQPNSHDLSDQEILGAIQSNSRYVVDLLDSMLDIARSEAGQVQQPSVCSPHELAADVLNSFSVQAKTKGLDLQFQPAKRLPTKILVDEMRLRRILVNLVSNAIKYSSTGTVTISVEEAPSDSKPDGGHATLLWKVRDQGPGISREDIARLCAPFYRGKAGKSSVSCGNGLGLFITKRLVKLLGGELSVVSSLGRGTTFSVSLPVSVPPSDPQPRPAAATVTSAPKSALRGSVSGAEKKGGQPAAGRLLIVENDPDLRRLLHSFLTRNGLHVTIAGDAFEALAIAWQNCDAILLDLQLPKMNGWSTARRLRALGYANPIVAFSGEAPPSQAAIAASGFTGFLHKTISLQRLLTTCLEYLPPGSRAAVDRRQDSAGPAPDFAELQGDYVLHLSGALDELQTALSLGNRAALQKISHRIMGTSGLYGLTTIGESARRLNRAVLTGQPSEMLGALVQHFKLEVQKAVRPFQLLPATLPATEASSTVDAFSTADTLPTARLSVPSVAASR